MNIWDVEHHSFFWNLTNVLFTTWCDGMWCEGGLCLRINALSYTIMYTALSKTGCGEWEDNDVEIWVGGEDN